MVRQSIALTAALIASAALHAQTVPAPALPGGAQNAESILQAHQAAQAAARLPGDEALDCDALQEQLAAAVNDPAVQSYMQAAGAAAQKDLAAMEAAKGQMGVQTAATIGASLVPGGAIAAMTAGAAQSQAQQAQAAERVQSHAAQAQQLTTLMPKIMRGQRLIELAAAKGCEWAANASLNTGIPPADANSRAESDR